VVLTQRAATIDEDAQHGELLVVHDRAQPAHPGADQGDGMRVGLIGLAALTGGEDPRPSRQLRWHVHDLLAVSEQPVRDVPPDALTALYRPGPLLESPAVGEHHSVSGGIGRVTATTQDRLVAGHPLDRGRPLVRIHANDLCAHRAPPSLEPTGVFELGGHRYFEQHKPLLSLSPPTRRRPAHPGQMRATRPAWAAEMRATSRAPRPNPARHRPGASEQVAEIR
jgi:hypothetical protein